MQTVIFIVTIQPAAEHSTRTYFMRLIFENEFHKASDYYYFVCAQMKARTERCRFEDFTQLATRHLFHTKWILSKSHNFHSTVTMLDSTRFDVEQQKNKRLDYRFFHVEKI